MITVSVFVRYWNWVTSNRLDDYVREVRRAVYTLFASSACQNILILSHKTHNIVEIVALQMSNKRFNEKCTLIGDTLSNTLPGDLNLNEQNKKIWRKIKLPKFDSIQTTFGWTNCNAFNDLISKRKHRASIKKVISMAEKRMSEIEWKENESPDAFLLSILV